MIEVKSTMNEGGKVDAGEKYSKSETNEGAISEERGGERETNEERTQQRESDS